jgi:hypothetical protein
MTGRKPSSGATVVVVVDVEVEVEVEVDGADCGRVT